MFCLSAIYTVGFVILLKFAAAAETANGQVAAALTADVATFEAQRRKFDGESRPAGGRAYFLRRSTAATAGGVDIDSGIGVIANNYYNHYAPSIISFGIASKYGFAIAGYIFFSFLVYHLLLWPALYTSYRLKALRARYISNGHRIQGSVVDRESSIAKAVFNVDNSKEQNFSVGSGCYPLARNRYSSRSSRLSQEYILFVSYNATPIGGGERLIKPFCNMTQRTYDDTIRTKTISLIGIKDVPKSAVPEEFLKDPFHPFLIERSRCGCYDCGNFRLLRA